MTVHRTRMAYGVQQLSCTVNRSPHTWYCSQVIVDYKVDGETSFYLGDRGLMIGEANSPGAGGVLRLDPGHRAEEQQQHDGDRDKVGGHHQEEDVVLVVVHVSVPVVDSTGGTARLQPVLAYTARSCTLYSTALSPKMSKSGGRTKTKTVAQAVAARPRLVRGERGKLVRPAHS